jgi:ATP-binding cassette, subfamily C (CFTR/MRP), member 1
LADEEIDSAALVEKLTRRRSFPRATLAELPPPTQSSSSQGLSVEKSQTGRVDKRVYARYIEAASKIGFFLFVGALLLQQVFSVLSSVELKAWGEGNRSAGNNKDALRYLWAYGVFSLISAVLGSASAILVWVLCSYRSSKHLHDAVSPPRTSLMDRVINFS